MFKQSLWALAAALLFSLMAAFVKLTSNELGTLELVFYRSVFGVLSIGFFVLKSGLSVKTPYLWGNFKRSVLGTLSVALWFYTLGKLPFGTNMTLIYTTPLFMAAIEATEEAILDSLFLARDVRGFDGELVKALPVERVLEMLGARAH